MTKKIRAVGAAVLTALWVTVTLLAWFSPAKEISAAERGGYAHFMLKEIMEQPKAIHDTLSPRIRDGRVVLEGIDLPKERLQKLRKIYLVACGSAYYVSVLAKYTLEKACRIPTEAVMASEFRYAHHVYDSQRLRTPALCLPQGS